MFKHVMVRAIRFYQRALSPLMGASCRFTPTCSAYAIEAIERHGALSGGWLAAKRILRCHPFGGQGYDPVPQLPTSETTVAIPQNSHSHEELL